MGRPIHYSAEVPARCRALIDLLAQRVEDASDPDGRWGGPLKTTFLLAMATPMLVLPIERIFKPAKPNYRGVADDRDLDPGLAHLVDDHLGADQLFGLAPFFEPGEWRFAPDVDRFEVGGIWPHHALNALRDDDALREAEAASTQAVLLTLRNALAHGGVTYLDRNGHHTEHATYMLGFASFAQFPRLRLLRISVPAFQRFLERWTEWLGAAGVLERLERRGPGYFEYAAE